MWFHPEELYFPSDLDTHLVHTQPEINFEVVSGVPDPLTTSNLDSLNDLGGANIYLTSKDDITTQPSWLNGNTPDGSQKTDGITAAVIVTDKGDGTVDAFYMYFYSYDWGGIVRIPFFGIEIGNYGDHVGDWEYNMIRFVDGRPTYIWYSQHGDGQAFNYNCTEKDGQRPIDYSANGTHANYAIAGNHDHTIPDLNLDGVGVLTDFTGRGKLWDPLLSANFYSYRPSAGTFNAFDGTAATAWLEYKGKWGDEEYPESDKRQEDLFGHPKYASGPNGPQFKELDREKVCPSSEVPCVLRNRLGP